MTVRISEAQTSAELDDVFRLRHQVFVDEEHYMKPRPDRRIADRFDAYPSSSNIVAVADDQIVGAIRFMERSPAGVSTDEFFDFTGHVEPGLRDGSSGMLVVARQYRSTPRLVVTMMAMGYLWAASRGLTHLLGTINPERLEAFRRTGYRQVAPQFHHELRNLDVVPMVLETNSLSYQFADFIRRHSASQSACPGERQFHTAHELVIAAGDRGDVAYRIVDGRAAVINDWGDKIRECGPGDIFGELALLQSRPRSATVLALNDLDLAVIGPDTLEGQLQDRSHGDRLRKATSTAGSLNRASPPAVAAISTRNMHGDGRHADLPQGRVGDTDDCQPRVDTGTPRSGIDVDPNAEALDDSTPPRGSGDPGSAEGSEP